MQLLGVVVAGQALGKIARQILLYLAPDGVEAA